LVYGKPDTEKSAKQRGLRHLVMPEYQTNIENIDITLEEKVDTLMDKVD
jgi:hypothetical protein